MKQIEKILEECSKKDKKVNKYEPVENNFLHKKIIENNKKEKQKLNKQKKND